MVGLYLQYFKGNASFFLYLFVADSEAAVEAGDVISVQVGDVISVVVVTAVISVVVVTAETLTPAIGMLTEMTAGEVVVWTDEEYFMSLILQILIGKKSDSGP